MKDAIELIKALVPLAWPLILIVVLWKIFPTIKAVAISRSFAIKIAGMEVSVQDATEQLRTQIEDLQKQVIELRSHNLGNIDLNTTAILSYNDTAQPKILWVDDQPSNNAFEIAQLQDQNVKIIQALSTDEALKIIQDEPSIKAIVSDMGRHENNIYQRQAGLLLLQAARRAGYKTPFMIYSSAQSAQKNRDLVIGAGGDGITSSTIELLEWLRPKIGLLGKLAQ